MMTEQDFIAAVEATGATDVWTMAKPTDHGATVGVSFLRNGTVHRNAVTMPLSCKDEDAFPALLDWVKNPL